MNGKKVKAMVDTEATHNFISQAKVNKFGLRLTEMNNTLKTVNSETKFVRGMVEENLKVGQWEGRVKQMAVP